MLGASTTHRPSPGKSILVICCGEPCMENMRKRILCKPWPAPLTVLTRYELSCQGDTIQLMTVRQVETVGRSQLYDEIYTCGEVYLPERTMHLLQARLANPREWPGYFSKFA